MEKKKNLLIIGACGGVGRAFLRTLARDRGRLGKLVLVDKQDPLLDDRILSHQELDCEFLKATIDVDERPG